MNWLACWRRKRAVRLRARCGRAEPGYTLFGYIYIFAVLCCLPQLVYLVYLYSTLRLSTQIMINYPEEYSLPSLSFCLPIVAMLDLRRLNQTRPNLLQLFARRVGQPVRDEADFVRLLRRLDARDELIALLDQHVGINRLADFLLDKREMIAAIEVNGVKNLPPAQPPLTSEQVGARFCRLDYVNVRWLVCLAVTCKVHHRFRLRLEQQRIINLNRDRGVIARVFISEQLMRRNSIMKVYIHYTSLPKGLLLPFAIVGLHDTPHLYMFQFKMYLNKLLPAPYATNCKNYARESRFDSQLHQRENCQNDQSIRLLNCPFFGNSLNLTTFERRPPDAQVINLGYSEHYVHYEQNKLILSRIIRRCEQQTPSPDCIQSYYVPHFFTAIGLQSTLLQAPPARRALGNCSVFQLMTSAHPMMINEYAALVRLNELVYLLASVLGSWTTFRLSQTIKRVLLWFYVAFHQHPGRRELHR